MHDSAARLFDALSATPGRPPSNFTADQRIYYYEHQDTVLSSVVNKIEADQTKTEARVMVVLEEIINVHEYGVPKSVWDRTDIKSGYILESELTCSGRLDQVIAAVDSDKYVAFDVLSGTGIADLARSPTRYLRRKHENCRVNARKSHEKKQAEKAKRANTKTPAAPGSRSSNRMPRTLPVRQPNAVAQSLWTPTPSLPVAHLPLDQALHQQYGEALQDVRPQELKRKADFDVDTVLKRMKYKDAEE